MTPREIALVQSSWRDVQLLAEPAAAVQALGQGLGASFTRDVEHAWRTAYGVLAGTMKQAARANEPIES